MSDSDASLPLSVLTALDKLERAIRWHQSGGGYGLVDEARAALLHSLREMESAATVTRFEVIDHRSGGGGRYGPPRGRVFGITDCGVELSYQDDRRTLKVFVIDAARTPQPETR
jgi:hypothetical protein